MSCILFPIEPFNCFLLKGSSPFWNATRRWCGIDTLLDCPDRTTCYVLKPHHSHVNKSFMLILKYKQSIPTSNMTYIFKYKPRSQCIINFTFYHQSFRYLSTRPNLSRRQCRWMELLEEFLFGIYYITSKKMLQPMHCLHHIQQMQSHVSGFLW